MSPRPSADRRSDVFHGDGSAGRVPDVTVGVVSWNTRDLLRECLLSVDGDRSVPAIEVYVVDNNSHDGTIDMLRQEFPHVRVLVNSENVGFARAANQVGRLARGPYWLLLNPDAQLKPGCLGALTAFMAEHPRAALTSARLLNTDGTPQYCAQAPPSILRVAFEMTRLHKLLPKQARGRLLLSSYWSYDRAIQLGWAWGTALIARMEAVEQVGSLDDTFFLYGEDVDWCLRMRRAGWQVWFCPSAEVVHAGAKSTSQRWSERERTHRICEAYYRAVRGQRGVVSMRSLQMVTLLALLINWVMAKVRVRSSARAYSELLRLHFQFLRSRSVVSRVSNAE